MCDGKKYTARLGGHLKAPIFAADTNGSAIAPAEDEGRRSRRQLAIDHATVLRACAIRIRGCVKTTTAPIPSHCRFHVRPSLVF